jgi:anti-sigma factor RsiW
MTGHFSDCGDIRHALGVYVVGAIEPAERADVDAHLAHCADCREELAGLAGLPALLGRVPAADAERLALGSGVLEEPPAELLDSLLQHVSLRRRARKRRLLTAAAAAAVIAIGGGIAGGAVISQPRSSAPPSGVSAQHEPPGLARGGSAGVNMAVYYDSSSSGTRMQVQVTGIPAGDHCVFWAVTRAGAHLAAGEWTATGAGTTWYPAWTPHPVTQLTGFDVSVGGHVMVRVPLSS